MGLIGKEAVQIVIAQMIDEACDLVFRYGLGNLQSQTCYGIKKPTWSWWLAAASGASRSMATSSAWS